MLTFALALAALGGDVPAAATPSTETSTAAPGGAAAPKKPKAAQVCTGDRMTGSRVSRGKRCVSAEEADEQAEQMRRAVHERQASQRAR